MSSVIQNIKLAQIRTDGGTQPRAALNEATVAEYAEAITEGAKLPPIIVYHDGSDYWLADGFHRFHAHRKIDALDISAEVVQGTKRDAILRSVGANAAHGLRRTNDDKRKAVSTLLDDAEWAKWTDVAIARACGVSSNFVGDMRRIINPINDSQTRTVSRSGKTYEQNTANIGKKQAASPVTPQAMPEKQEQDQGTPAEYADSSSFDDEEVDAQAEIERLSADNEMMGKVFDADDKLAEAMSELKRATEENRVLRERINGLMNEKNAAVQQAKMWRNKFEKLEKVSA